MVMSSRIRLNMMLLNEAALSTKQHYVNAKAHVCECMLLQRQFYVFGAKGAGG